MTALSTMTVSRFLPKLGVRGMMIVGASLVGLQLAAIAFGPDWKIQLVILLFMGWGFYMIHGCLQVFASELSVEARATALALHSFFFFLGQTVGPIAYGFDAQLPVYFNQDPVLNVGGGGGGFGGRGGEGGGPGVGMNITPMAGAAQQRLSPYDAENPEATGAGACEVLRRTALEDLHVDAGRRQLPRQHQARGSGTHHRDVRHAPSPVIEAGRVVEPSRVVEPVETTSRSSATLVACPSWMAPTHSQPGSAEVIRGSSGTRPSRSVST